MTSDRVSAELAKAIATLFPPTSPPGTAADPEATRREAERVAMFTESAEKVLSLVVGEDAGEIVINRLLIACLTAQQHASAINEEVERLHKEIGTASARLARTGKAEPSKDADDIVSQHANRLWAREPGLRQSAHGTAVEIADKVNADLKKGDLAKLGAKRARRVRHREARRAVIGRLA